MQFQASSTARESNASGTNNSAPTLSDSGTYSNFANLCSNSANYGLLCHV